MKYLMDTDWIIHWLNGKQNIVEKVKRLREKGLGISIISIAEIYEGIFGSEDPERHEKTFKEFLTGVSILEITEEVCKKFGELRNKLRQKGELIGDFDLLIASTALINNLTILSDNVEHYKKIEGLKFETSKR